jgi:hypothetical protein
VTKQSSTVALPTLTYLQTSYFLLCSAVSFVQANAELEAQEAVINQKYGGTHKVSWGPCALKTASQPQAS